MEMNSHAPPFGRYLIVAGMVLLAGCGQQAKDGPDRFQLSGKVTYGGKPVPMGSIRFSPDTDKGNEGPGTSVKIENGAFRTSPGMGIVGGPMRVEINGFDGVPLQADSDADEFGKELFSGYRTEIDLPRKDGEHDFEVPTVRK